MSAPPSSKTPSSPATEPFNHNYNASMLVTAFSVTNMKPFVPFYKLTRSGPFDARSMWKNAVQGIRALQHLASSSGRQGGSSYSHAVSDLVVVSGHVRGHMNVWDATTHQLLKGCTHFNQVTVAHLLVTTRHILTNVDRASTGSADDEVDVYVWDVNTLELLYKLQAHDGKVSCIAVDERKESRVITSGHDRMLFVWDLDVSTSQPVGKLEGHTNPVVKVIAFDRGCISGSSDSSLRIWDLNTMQCVSILEGHQGQISVLEWFSKPTITNNNTGLFLSGCNGGFVRSWNISVSEDTDSIQHSAGFVNKAHKAMVTEICTDYNSIVVSCSSTDGVAFYDASKKLSAKVQVFETGVRHLAIDPQRKLCIAGTDLGQVNIFSYHNFGVRLDEDSVVLVSSFQPHLGGITGMILERGRGHEWERVIISSNDQGIFTMDFDLTRDASIVKTPGLCRTLPQIPETGNLILQTESGAVLYDWMTLAKTSGAKKSIVEHKGKITALRYSAHYHKIITGGDDGKVKLFSAAVFLPDELESSHCEEVFVDVIKEFDLNMVIRCLSDPSEDDSQLVAIGLQRNPTSRQGGIAVLDLNKDDLTAVTIPLPSIYPVSLKMMVHEKNLNNNITGYTVLAQMRTGEIVQFRGEIETSVFTQQRVIVKEQLKLLTEEGIASVSDMSPMPTNFLCWLNKKFDPPMVEFMYAEASMKALRSIVGHASAETSTTVAFNVFFESDITVLEKCEMGPLTAALVCDSHVVNLLNNRGETLFQINYDGSVIDAVQESVKPARRRRSYIRPDPPSVFGVRYPTACAVTSCQMARIVAIGYTNGVVQLWDLPTKRVFKRIIAHSSPIVSIFSYPLQSRIVSTAAAGGVRMDVVHARALRDIRNSSSATPTAGDLEAQRSRPITPLVVS